MYIDEEVHELRRIEAVSIPVDFHIVEITNRLSGGAAEFNRFNEEVIVSLLWLVYKRIGERVSGC